MGTRQIEDLTGKKFGRLTVIKYAGKKQSGNRYKTMWLCQCDCGNQKEVCAGQLKNGKTTSCGCYHKEVVGALNRKHMGINDGRLYPLWKSIKYRCFCETCRDYLNYGGRGITMCDEWKTDYTSFREWALNNGYKEEKTEKGRNILTIDRVDVNGNYCPENCRFVTEKVQARNKRNSMTDLERYRICPICGKEFEVTQRNGEKTCSRECGVKLRTLTHPNTKDYTKICPVCGKEFNAQRDGHYNSAVYCSVKCKNLSLSPIWEYNGEKLRVVEWADRLNISAHCLLHRKDMGWSIEEILTTPLGGKRHERAI